MDAIDLQPCRLLIQVARIDDEVHNLDGDIITSPKSGKTYVSQDAVILYIGYSMCRSTGGYFAASLGENCVTA